MAAQNVGQTNVCDDIDSALSRAAQENAKPVT
jgi:hypothetical protein